MIHAFGPSRRLGPALITTVLLLGSCGSGGGAGPELDDSSGVVGGEVVADEPTPTPVPVELSADRQRAVDRMSAAIDLLLAEPATEVSWTAANLDGGSSVGVVEIDNTSGNFTLRDEFVPEINPDVLVISERVLLDDAIYARIFGPDDDPDESVWSRSTPGSLRPKFVDEAYTALGGAGVSLGRIIVLLEGVPWTLEGSALTDVDGQMIESFLVRFTAEDIWRFFAQNDLELVGPVVPDGSTLYELWIDDETGALVRLLAGGVQFQDGEPLEDAEIEITYRALASVEITAPADVAN